MMRSRSRWNGDRVECSDSGWSRPRLSSGFDANGARPTARTMLQPYAASCLASIPVHKVKGKVGLCQNRCGGGGVSICGRFEVLPRAKVLDGHCGADDIVS